MLCDQYVPTFERVGPLENPTFPTSDKPDAYMTVPAITQLVREALEFWGEPTDVLDVLKVSVMRSTKMHGAFSLKVGKANMQRASDLIRAMPPDVRRDKAKTMAALSAEKVYDLALKFSRDSLEHMPVQDRVNTIVHETAHLVDFMRSGTAEGDGHGPSWKALMAEAGVEANKTGGSSEAMRAHAECDCRYHVVDTQTGAAIAARAALGLPAEFKCLECKAAIRDVKPPQATDARRRFEMAVRRNVAKLRERQQRALADAARSAATMSAHRAAEQYARLYSSALRSLERAAEVLARAGDSAGALSVYRQGLAQIPVEELNVMDTGPGTQVGAIRYRIKQLESL